MTLSNIQPNELYAPKGKHLKDVWFFVEGKTIHMFHMQRDASVAHEKRHQVGAEIAHAVSTDLVRWTDLGVALSPRDPYGKSQDKEDFTLATGSTIQHDRLFYMFYTQRNDPDDLRQNIGVATSHNLLSWKKYDGNPILSPDESIYDNANSLDSASFGPAWRDPYAFRDPKTGQLYMSISAREKCDDEFNACIALARSKNNDPFEWEILPPLIAPGKHREMEVSQVICRDGRWYVFFSAWNTGNKDKNDGSGLYCYISSSGLDGDYEPAGKNGLVVDNGMLLDRFGFDLYGMRLIEIDLESSTLPAIGWVHKDKDGRFVQKLSPPFNIHLGDNVRISDV